MQPVHIIESSCVSFTTARCLDSTTEFVNRIVCNFRYQEDVTLCVDPDTDKGLCASQRL